MSGAPVRSAQFQHILVWSVFQENKDQRVTCSDRSSTHVCFHALLSLWQSLRPHPIYCWKRRSFQTPFDNRWPNAHWGHILTSWIQWMSSLERTQHTTFIHDMQLVSYPHKNISRHWKPHMEQTGRGRALVYTVNFLSQWMVKAVKGKCGHPKNTNTHRNIHFDTWI